MGALVALAGEPGLPVDTGDGDLALEAGDVGRASRDVECTDMDGLAARGMPPIREMPEAAGEPVLGLAAPNRDICEGCCCDDSGLSGLAGIRFKRSSS